MDITITKYQHRRGGSFIEFPEWVNNKKCGINIQNTDERCIDYVIAYHFTKPKKNPQRPNQYQEWILNNIKNEGIQYPIAIKQLDKYCKLNNISLDVWEVFDIEDCCNLRFASKGAIKAADRHINLLMYKNHFMYLKSKTAFWRHKPGKTSHQCIKCYHLCQSEEAFINYMKICMARKEEETEETTVCGNCNNHMQSHEHLVEHRKDCGQFESIKVKMQYKGKRENKNGKLVDFDNTLLRFKSWRELQRIPYIFYADFEALLVETTNKKGKSIFEHNPISFGLLLLDTKKRKVMDYIRYRGEDCMIKFFEAIDKLRRQVVELYKINIPMYISRKQQEQFDAATECIICKKKFEKDDIKVRDHDHMTGKFRGAAHQQCNLNTNFVGLKTPCFIHNFSGYDSHLIMAAYGSYMNKKPNDYLDDSSPECIAKSSEKFVSVTFMKTRFLHSNQFLLGSLDNLVKAAVKDGGTDILKYTASRFRKENIALVSSKMHCAYTYAKKNMDYESTTFPEKHHYNNDLTNEECTVEMYERVKKFREINKCVTFGDEFDAYLDLDIFLLADVVENFRDKCLKLYKLDPAWNYSLPGFSWKCMLKRLQDLEIKVELIQDIDHHLMFERGFRGGICMVNKRKSTAGENKHILYIDANNLYGWAMCQKLPDGNYKWENPTSFTESFIHNIADDADVGYVLEVDLSFPTEIHDALKDYAPAVEKTSFTDSAFMSTLADLADINRGDEKKLIPNLESKERYVIHYRNLKYFLELGVNLEKVHRVISFTQSYWLKSYVEYNAEMRKKATSDIEKDIFKLLNNAIFGRTLMNKSLFRDIKLVENTENNKRWIQELVNKYNYQDSKINDNLLMINMKNAFVSLDTPVSAGFSILDLSKLHMYKMYYSILKPKWGDNVKLLYTDTDSFILEIDNVSKEQYHKDLLDMASEFDFSNYKRDHTLFNGMSEEEYQKKIAINKGVLGKFKDEAEGDDIGEFIGLKPKLYSIVDKEGMKMKKKAKGAKKVAIKSLKHV